MSNNINNNEIMLIGTGRMAKEYAKVLLAQKKPFIVIGRGEKSAKDFHAVIGITPIKGGVKNWLEQNSRIPSTAIVAVNIEELTNTTFLLLENGVKRILVEKPGGRNINEIKILLDTLEKNKAEVYVGFNRRFYTSTIQGKELIKEDGGVSSFYFEFTEWSHLIAKNMNISTEVKRNWLLANSSHVIDMAFYLGGKPSEMTCYKNGSLPWHPASSVFSGAGITEKGALFSYQANWASAGSWKIEISTPKRRIIYHPLEELHVQMIGLTTIERININDFLDKTFKPGLYRQVASFLSSSDSKSLITIEEWLYNAKQILKIAY